MSTDTSTTSMTSPTTHAWWRDAVIYQVYPRSFADSDGDGTGDLRGIRTRLPYLAELGVDAVWLSPFYASPQADGGYDVSDYRAIDPVFGELGDIDDIVADAHDVGLRIIVDLVPNHSSDQHAWFRQAVEDGPGSPMRSRYHFRDGRGENGELPPNDWESVFGGPAWTRVADEEWYLHLFAPEQPDFNWQNPEVAEEFRAILRFWLDRGVDGFRVDVAHGLVKAEGLPDIGSADQVGLLGNAEMPYFDQDGVHRIYRDWRKVLAEYGEDRIGVAEAWTSTLARLANYVRSDELHQAFNFDYLGTHWDAEELRDVIDRSLDGMREVGAPVTWALSNHDVTRHATRFAHELRQPTQTRDAGDRGLGLRRARAATLVMLALPGSAYLYQGEELGLPDVTDLADEVRQDPSFFQAMGQDGFRDGCRVPFPWSRQGRSFGFGPGGSWLPQPPEWGDLSVEAQTGDPASTLEMYRAALAIRRQQRLGQGDDVVWLDLGPHVLAFRRNSVVCTANISHAPARFAAPGQLLLASGVVQAGDDAVLDPDVTAWWSV